MQLVVHDVVPAMLVDKHPGVMHAPHQGQLIELCDCYALRFWGAPAGAEFL
jgi:hypothetical protein